MKSRLLALMTLCCATSASLPLWAAEWADPELSFVNPDLDGIKNGARKAYYVYHVDSKMFMSAGNQYGTTFIVSNNGQEVTLSYGEDYELVTHKDNTHSDAKSYRLSMFNAGSNGGFHEIFMASGGTCYVDHNTQGHILWDILPQENGLYRIRINEDDPLYGSKASEKGETWMGVNPNADGTWDEIIKPMIIPGTAGYENAKLDWKFVDPKVYEIYAAKKNVLKPQLEAADEIGFTDYQKYKEVYESADATVAQIEGAAEELKDAILQYKYSSATEGNPADLTEKVKNASFGDKFTDWRTWRETTNNNFQVITKSGNDIPKTSDGFEFVTFVERWVPTGSVTGDYYVEQDLTDLPDGKYRLGAYIMTNQTEENGGAAGLFLYASTLMGESKTEADGAAPGGTTAAEGAAYASPYSVDFSVIDGTATIGFRSEGYKGNWSAVGYFTLKYMGKEGAATMREVLNGGIKEAEQQYEELKISKHSKEGDKKYEDMMALAKAAAANDKVTDDSLMSVRKSLILCMSSLKSDVAAYEKLSQKTAELSAAWEESVYADLDLTEYDNFLTELESAHENGTFDPAEIDSIQPRADRIWKAGILEALKNGETKDVTGLLVNPNFTGGTNGWTHEKLGGKDNGGLKYANNVAECYEHAFDVYQEIDGLPSGSYEISVQSFYRPANTGDWLPAWGVDGDHTNDVLAYVYGNDGMNKVAHLAECPQEENVGENCSHLENSSDPKLNDKYVCNGLKSAEMIFAGGENYLVKVNCYVGEDGKLRFGVKMPAQTEYLSGYWTAFDNFHVTYLGADDMSGAKSAVAALIQNANDMLYKEVLTTVEAKNDLETAVANALGAVENLTPESYKECCDALNAAIEGGQKAIDAATALDKKATAHDEKLQASGEDSYEAYNGTDGFDELSDIVLEILEKADNDGAFASMDEIDDYNTKLNKAYSKMLSGHIDFSTASKEKQVDATSLIVNPSFRTRKLDETTQEWTDVSSADGWTTTGGKATSGLNYEIYNDSCYIEQKLYNMPAGYYRLVYSGFYRSGDAVPAALARRDSVEAMNAEVYIEGKESKWSEKLVSIFENLRERKYVSADVVLPDSLFPGSSLLYNCIVNDVAGARMAFEDGAYEGSFSFRVEEGEEPVLGVRKIAKIKNDWACFGNFRLYYYGEGDANKPDDFVSSVEETVADGMATVVSSAWYTINGVRVAEPTQRGIYIRHDKMSDGTVKAVKVIVR